MNVSKWKPANDFLSRKPRAILCGTSCALGLWLLLSGTALSQSSAQRDEKALAVLTQTISAVGGSQLLASIQDITETGKITYHEFNSDEIQGNVTVKARGLHHFLMESDLSTGKRTISVNGYSGLSIGEDGKRVPLQGQSAADLGSLAIPYLPLVEAMRDTSISILYEGLVTHNNTSAYDIRIEKVSTRRQGPQGNQGKQETRDIYIDPNTLLITAIADQFSLAGHSLAHEDTYSDYQTNHGILLPLTITQSIGGSNRFTMNLEQVTINTNLTDADFSR